MDGSGECLTMMRWILINYPPFSFVYEFLTRKKCRNLWDQILKGHGLFSVCLPGSNIGTLQISGYVKISGETISFTVNAGSLSDLSNLANTSLYGFEDYHGVASALSALFICGSPHLQERFQ
ncbi:putative LRR receptor-like serine/threonine-protein kinase [Forsythia ovata]|uniref:LRR receptor-like serine/threonine-protein kinase n=1 Tax=Forsythia ovata TaxID=205694 RepID=A0ABD1S0I4_9LAMI